MLHLPYKENNDTCMSLLITNLHNVIFTNVSCIHNYSRVVMCQTHNATIPAHLNRSTQDVCGVGQFQCNDMACILDIFICDGFQNCKDNSDEGKLVCHKIDHYYFSTLIFTSNNIHCFLLKYLQNFTNSPKVSGVWFMKYELLNMLQYINQTASTLTSEGICMQGTLPCHFSTETCYELNQQCVFDTDYFGNLIFCKSGDRLINCNGFSCNDLFTCPGAYCLPWRRVCDETVDCPGGYDELYCSHYKCPGMLKCLNTLYCVHTSEICDGYPNCPYGDDEYVCKLPI